jgi:thiamine pyrophosphate-dependent acetolactate synthase large subunit-like protein
MDKSAPIFGSDVVAELLHALGVEFLAINPGASFRGLHDSVVNHLGNREPTLILTLHEAQAVAIAHGYAKVAGRPIGVVLHANVGLMNAVMAIYDAYVDRAPMLILGATGAVDAARRRPWIEWIHTSRDQAAMIRPFLKWDDQPASVAAAVESILRAWSATRSTPNAPTYVCLDVDLQESETGSHRLPDPARFMPLAAPVPGEADLARAIALLKTAKRPLMLVGRHDRTETAWQARIRLAERLGASVVCDQKVGVGFPSAHPRFVSAPAQYPDDRTIAVVREADLAVSLDWPDLVGLLGVREDKGANLRTIIASPDERLHNGWTFDHFALPAADLRLPVKADTFVSAVLERLNDHRAAEWQIPPSPSVEAPSRGAITIPALIAAFDRVRGERPICLTRLTFGTPDAMVRFTGPLDCIGMDGGGGIGSTPGITVGAALALKGTGRLPVAILGDGDLLMGSQALWTAAAYKLPCLFIVNNNQSFHNDVEHQEIVARRRGRPIENKTVGMAISDPAVDVAALAQSYGLTVFGPVANVSALDATLEDAFLAAEAGSPTLVDVLATPPPLRRR